ncbi:B-box zinc finger protein 20 isoform X1 [Aegilops tauschii subsp. strangulata]|uniref:B box-type domain-containing protein n=2 Tax=Aegilops tauschii TaxID=37682 RepID=A0A453CJA0_AEGTS
MKVQCDVCEAEAASVFCCADEAALCDACDRRVHRANKLAGKHRRLSLLHPSPASSSSPSPKPPLCDICQVGYSTNQERFQICVPFVLLRRELMLCRCGLQEKRGLLFCKEDRAILCRECDVQVHTASELTRRHGRFLLTGVRVSSAPAESPAPSGQEEEGNSTSPCIADSCSGDASGTASASASASDGSSISEYLTKTLPGWHVEDFLLDDAAVAVSSNKPYQGGGLARIGGPQEGEGYPAWAGQEQLIGGVVVAAGERASRELWVPQMHAGAAWAGSKRPRPSSLGSSSYW